MAETEEEKEACSECGTEGRECFCAWHGACQNLCECGDCGLCVDEHDSCYYCDMCIDNPLHVTCDNCGECRDNCCCESHGSSKKAPWEDILPSSESYNFNTKWNKVYPILAAVHEQVDPIQEAASFYLAEAMAAGVVHYVPGVSKTVIGGKEDEEFFSFLDVGPKKREKLLVGRAERLERQRTADPEFNLAYVMGQAELALREQVDKLDPIFMEYVMMACGGEVRHHRAIGGRCLPGSRSGAWAGVSYIHEKVGNKSLMMIADLFEEFESDGYGGTLWADAARVLYDRLEENLGPNDLMNRRMFVDRVWTLEHNNGCFLNKLTWGILNRKVLGLDSMTSVLNMHSSDPPNFRGLLKLANDKVVELYEDYVQAVNEVLISRGIEPVASYSDPGEQRTACPHCFSHPEKGHHITCFGMLNSHLRNQLTAEHPEPGTWLTVDEEDFVNYNWHTWEKGPLHDGSKAYFNTKGRLIFLDPEQVIVIDAINQGPGTSTKSNKFESPWVNGVDECPHWSRLEGTIEILSMNFPEKLVKSDKYLMRIGIRSEKVWGGILWIGSHYTSQLKLNQTTTFADVVGYDFKIEGGVS